MTFYALISYLNFLGKLEEIVKTCELSILKAKEFRISSISF